MCPFRILLFENLDPVIQLWTSYQKQSKARSLEEGFLDSVIKNSSGCRYETSFLLPVAFFWDWGSDKLSKKFFINLLLDDEFLGKKGVAGLTYSAALLSAVASILFLNDFFQNIRAIWVFLKNFYWIHLIKNWMYTDCVKCEMANAVASLKRTMQC